MAPHTVLHYASDDETLSRPPLARFYERLDDLDAWASQPSVHDALKPAAIGALVAVVILSVLFGLKRCVQVIRDKRKLRFARHVHTMSTALSNSRAKKIKPQSVPDLSDTDDDELSTGDVVL